MVVAEHKENAVGSQATAQDMAAVVNTANGVAIHSAESMAESRAVHKFDL